MPDEELVARVGGGDTVSIPADAPMPEVEEGHKGREMNPGDIFDPNAARRLAEGRGPGLQDSEIQYPAHWNREPPPPDADRPAEQAGTTSSTPSATTTSTPSGSGSSSSASKSGDADKGQTAA